MTLGPEFGTLHGIIEAIIAGSEESQNPSFLVQAYLAIAHSPKIPDIASVARKNPVYRTLRQYVGYDEEQNRYKWIMKPITLGNRAITDVNAVQNASEAHVQLVAPLYDLSTIILDQEGSDLNLHTAEHLRRVQKQAEYLLHVSSEHGKKIKFSKIDLLTAYLSINQHDVGLGVAGRKNHAVVGWALTPLILRTHRDVRNKRLQAVPEIVAQYVNTHVTSRYTYGEIDPVYGLLILADESDICRARTHEGVKAKFDRGEEDPWFYLNYFTRSVWWSWSKEDDCPVMNFHTYVGDVEALSEHNHFIDSLKKRGIPIPNATMPEYFLDVLSALLVVPYQKNGLFKSICKALFGSTHFKIIVHSAGMKSLYTIAIQ